MMDMTDRTGEPRATRDYEDALVEIKKAMVSPMSLPPGLVVHLAIIKDGLERLILLSHCDYLLEVEKRHLGGQRPSG